MNATKSLIVTLILFISLTAYSQDIVTDRPDQTESSVTVGKKNFQIESGVLIQNTNNYSVKSVLGPSTLLRYGISDVIELRFVSQYESTEIGLDGANIDYNGFNDLEIGTKIQLLKKVNVNTEIAFLSHLVLPTGKGDLTTGYVGTINKLAVSHVISDKVGLGYNIGYDYVEGRSSLTYSLALGMAFSDVVGFYIEPFGTWAEQNDFEGNLDAGFTYLLNNNFQLDISYGVGLNNDMQYVSAGFSWKIPNFLVKTKI